MAGRTLLALFRAKALRNQQLTWPGWTDNGSSGPFCFYVEFIRINVTVEDLINLLQKQDKTLQACRYILGTRHLLQEVVEAEYKALDESTMQWKTVKVVDVQ